MHTLTYPPPKARRAQPEERGGGRRTRAVAPLLGGLAVVLVAAACGGGTSAASSTTPTSRATGNSATTPFGTAGTVASVSASSIEVQSPVSGQTTVNFGPSTQFRQVQGASPSVITAGACVTAVGTPSGGSPPPAGTPFTARTISVTQPPPGGTCTRGSAIFGGAGGAGAAGPSGVGPPGSMRGTGAPRRNGAFRRAPTAFGTVVSVSGQTIAVQGTSRSTGATVTTQVSYDSSTVINQTTSATSAALSVGQCVVVAGPADQTGAVTANSIVIRPAGPNGCAGFRPGSGQGRSGGSGGSASAT